MELLPCAGDPDSQRSAGSTGGMSADRSIKTRRDWRGQVVVPGEADIEEKKVYVREYRKILLEGNGLGGVDLGINNAPERYVQAAKAHQPQVVGDSGPLTTALARAR